MSNNSNELKDRLEQFKEICKEKGLKLTHQRMEIFSEVAKSTEHPDVETIYKGVRKRIPSVSLDTVYRTLWLFMDLGLITTLGQPRERQRFDANIKAHHHFVCTKCGTTKDFYSKEFDSLPVPETVKELGDVNTTYVELRGLCSKCTES